MIKVEEKLFQNRYKVDAGRAHIEIVDADVCQLAVQIEALHLLLPGLVLHQGGRRSGDADHRRLPRVRHLPRDLQRARERALGLSARRLRHPIQIRLAQNPTPSLTHPASKESSKQWPT